MPQITFQWGPFLIFAFVQCATPGPNVVLLTSSGSAWGFKRSIPHLMGICFGFPLMFFLVQLGAKEIFERMPWIFTVFTVVSLVYVIWLAIKILRMGYSENIELHSHVKPMSFNEAVLFQWINGKAWQMVIMTATLYPSQDIETKVLGAICFFIILIFTGAFWIEVGKRVTALLENSFIRKLYYLLMAVALLLSTVPTGLKQLRELF